MFFGRASLALMSLCLPLAAEAATVAVYVDVPAGMTPQAQSAMVLETRRILDSAGIRLVWKRLSERDGRESFENLALFRFTGSCVAFVTGSSTTQGASLADTAVSDGRVLPFSTIHCERVARLLNFEPGRWAAAQRDEMFGRALGRVAAHELYHILGQTRGHHADGIAKACFSPADLVKAEFRLGTSAVAQIRPGRVEQPQDPGEDWSDESTGR